MRLAIGTEEYAEVIDQFLGSGVDERRDNRLAIKVLWLFGFQKTLKASGRRFWSAFARRKASISGYFDANCCLNISRYPLSSSAQCQLQMIGGWCV